MKHVPDESNRPAYNPSGEAIPVHPMILEAMKMTTPAEWKVLFQNLRLNLQGRILGLSGDDLIKLQGKLSYLDELEIFFSNLRK